MHRFSVICLLLLGCASPAPAPAPTTPGPAPTTDLPPRSDPATTSGLGEKCGASDACATGQTCVHYFGIAGPRGPELTSCEITCKDKAPCPSGTNCVTIADGPGQVCRP